METAMNHTLPSQKTIALIAHDSRKEDLVHWCKTNKDVLAKHKLVATGTTGGLINKEIGVEVKRYLSGPIGGDSQIGSNIVEGNIHMMIFFWDPLQTLGHDPDVKALLRLATLYNIPMACNQSTADFFIQSSFINQEYKRNLAMIENYKTKRPI